MWMMTADLPTAASHPFYWRLNQLLREHGFDDSADKGKASYTVLVSGGMSGFDAVLGGIRELDGKCSRQEEHGLYWTASENNPATAPFYNFGKGSQALYRQPQGEKQRAISARCVRG